MKHRGFKHVARPATLDEVLEAFGVTRADYERSKLAIYRRAEAAARRKRPRTCRSNKAVTVAVSH